MMLYGIAVCLSRGMWNAFASIAKDVTCDILHEQTHLFSSHVQSLCQ
jgi:hypothetical protein